MGGLLAHPALLETLLSASILVAALVAAQVVAAVVGALARRAERNGIGYDDRLLHALRRPAAYAVFLVGAWVAVHRLPVPPAWMGRLDSALFVVAVLLATLAATRALALFLEWYATRPLAAGTAEAAREFLPLVGKLGHVFLAVLAVIAVLQHLGVNVASLVVSLGVGSLAVGLAAQDTLANMFAGFTLLLDRPFRVGERIQLATGEVGDVESIGMRATLLLTTDETLLIVPNSALVKERIVNLSRPSRGLATRINVGVAYGSDLERVKQVLSAAALASDLVDPARAPAVIVNRFGDFAVNCLLVFWVKDYTQQGQAIGAVHAEIDRRLREAGIEIPTPVSRVIHEGAPSAPRAQ